MFHLLLFIFIKGVVIFYDALSQFKHTFEMKKTRVKPGIRARESIIVWDQEECEQRCREDKVYTF